MEDYQPFTLIGVALIIVGVVLVVLPFIARYIPSVEKVPWIIIWVYKSNGFIFATSPLLIIITIISVILSLLRKWYAQINQWILLVSNFLGLNIENFSLPVIEIWWIDYFLLRERNCEMSKVVNLPEVIYKDLASISDDLTSLAKKPISPAMTISLLISVYRAYMSEPCARDAFRQRIATSEFMSPEDFEKKWDTKSSKTKTK